MGEEVGGLDMDDVCGWVGKRKKKKMIGMIVVMIFGPVDCVAFVCDCTFTFNYHCYTQLIHVHPISTPPTPISQSHFNLPRQQQENKKKERLIVGSNH